MGALALSLKTMGYRVTGSDRNVYPPMSDFLRDRGIPVFEGFQEEHLTPVPELVVIGNAVSRDNPEVRAVARQGIPYCSLPQAVNRFLVAGRPVLMVTGTHGKTTTSGLLAWVLHCAGLDPAFMIGGILKDFDSNVRLGAGPFVVLEGDEYDTAFFDKGPKFLHYPPRAVIVTGIEFDHADIYRDLDHVASAFSRLMAIVDETALVVARAGDPVLDRVAAACPGRVIGYGKAADAASWQVSGVDFKPPWTHFRVFHQGRDQGACRLRMPGMHNVLNALSVIAVASDIGLSFEAIARGLATFSGVRRRQDVRGVVGGVTVIDDFAHHPTAVRETIHAIRPMVGAGRLIAVFEPRTNTSMRKVFQDAYARVFDDADRVLIRNPSALSKVPEADRIEPVRLVSALSARGVDARFFETTEGVLEELGRGCRPGDVVLVMSNGGFDNIHQRLLSLLENRSTVGSARP